MSGATIVRIESTLEGNFIWPLCIASKLPRRPSASHPTFVQCLASSVELDIAAQVNLKAQLGHHCRFDATGAMSLLAVRRINHLDMVGFVAGPHLVARHTPPHPPPLRHRSTRSRPP